MCFAVLSDTLAAIREKERGKRKERVGNMEGDEGEGREGREGEGKDGKGKGGMGRGREGWEGGREGAKRRQGRESFIKFFRTSDISVIAYCREMFQFDLPSAILKKRAEKFDSALLN